MTTEKTCAICLCPEDHCVCDESWPHEWKSRALAAEAEVERLQKEVLRLSVQLATAKGFIAKGHTEH